MVFMSLPAGQLGSNQARQAWPVDFEILEKGFMEKAPLPLRHEYADAGN